MSGAISSSGVHAAGAIPSGVTAAPYALVTSVTPQTMSTGNDITVSWDTEILDASNLHDLVTNPQRLTANKTGRWLIWVIGEYAANGTGARRVTVQVNATTVARVTQGATSGRTTAIPLTFAYPLSVGDFVTLNMLQDSGGNLATGTTVIQFGMTYLGP